MGRFEEIAYELKNIWRYLSREDICNYLNISDRSLYRYQSKLDLRKEDQKPLEIKQTQSMPVYINTPDNRVEKRTFKDWKHFVIWSKSQKHPFTITEGNVINMDYNKITKDAEQFLTSIK